MWRLGTGDTVDWPADTQGGERNTGVAQLIKQADGAIGYVDLSDATRAGCSSPRSRTRTASTSLPTLEGATAALAGPTVNDDLTYDPLDAAAPDAYPITAPTYMLVRPTTTDAAKAELVKAFLTLPADRRPGAGARGRLRAAARTRSGEQALAQLDKIQS